MIGALSALRQRARFALWAALTRARLRRHGGRLEIELAGTVRFDRPPRVRVHDLGEGDGRTVLTFGRGVSLGDGLVLELWAGGTNVLEVADGAFFQTACRVELRGGSIAIGEHAHVRDGAVLKSQGELTVGREVTISFGDVLACTERIEIGDLCGIGERVTITDSDHTHDGSDHHFLRQPLRIEPVRLGTNVLVSANAVILRGASVGSNSVIAAGAVVGRGQHPASTLLAGAPARPLKQLGA